MTHFGRHISGFSPIQCPLTCWTGSFGWFAGVSQSNEMVSGHEEGKTFHDRKAEISSLQTSKWSNVLSTSSAYLAPSVPRFSWHVASRQAEHNCSCVIPSITNTSPRTYVTRFLKRLCKIVQDNFGQNTADCSLATSRCLCRRAGGI